MTKILPIRLTEQEFAMIDQILASERCESENRSEWIRLLIHREWNKRKGLGAPKYLYQTANRFYTSPFLKKFMLPLTSNVNVASDKRRVDLSPTCSTNLSPLPHRTAGGVRRSAKVSRERAVVKLQRSAGKKYDHKSISD